MDVEACLHGGQQSVAGRLESIVLKYCIIILFQNSSIISMQVLLLVRLKLCSFHN